MIAVRSLLTSLDFEYEDDLVSLMRVFSRVPAVPDEFTIYVELVKPPYATGIGIDIRMMRTGVEAWSWGEELIELTPGDVIVVLAARAGHLELSRGAYSVELLLEGEVAATRMIYLGSRRGQK